MKSFLYAAFTCAGLFLASTFTSCKQDKCRSLICANNGTCNDDGSCSCPEGYEGNRCETISRDKFKGSWNVIEDGTTSNPSNYAISIENHPNIDQVYIRNFYNFSNTNVTAKVIGDTIIIPAQEIIQDGNTNTVEGKGYALPETFYGLHGKVILKYRVTNIDGDVNSFGFQGAGSPSEWSK